MREKTNQIPPRYTPLVTIGIPTYNRANSFLPLALQSALAQTYPNIEIIVSDNCSTDNTPEFVAGFPDPRLRYIRPDKNRGPNWNFNFCLQHAKGDYFLLLHDDDLIDDDFVDICMKHGNYSTRYGFIRTGTRTIDHKGNVLKEKPNNVTGPTKEDLYLSWFDGKTVVYLCSTLFSTTALREIGGLHSVHNLLQDAVAIAKISENRDHFDIVDVKASFRKSPQQLTYSAPVREWCVEFRTLLELIYKQVSNNKDIIRKKGESFFSAQSVSRAKAIRPRIRRALAYLTVARYFSPRYWP